MFLEKVTELLYPRRCPLCDGLLADREKYICASCRGKIRFIEGPRCMKCGRPLRSTAVEYCDNCRRREHPFVRGFAPFVYRNLCQESLMRFKYDHRAEYAGFYGAAICGFGRELLAEWKPQLILSVPVHRRRLIKRGYNQAEQIANAVSKQTGIPASDRLIRRRRNTKPQKGLTPEERRRNLAGAFTVSKGARFPERVLLVDDIYTTGATMDAMTEVLLKHGVKKVYVACVSIAPGRS